MSMFGNEEQVCWVNVRPRAYPFSLVDLDLWDVGPYMPLFCFLN